MLWGHLKWIGEAMAEKGTSIDIPLIKIADEYAPDGIAL